MLARLTALGVEAYEQAGSVGGSKSRAPPALYVTLADQLALVELYTILAPLEHLFRRPEREVKASVVRALSRYLYKRTFITLREAFTSEDPAVVEEAARALEELRFPHAFDPLARIYRESKSRLVRVSSLRAIARINTVEAAEMMLGVIEHEGTEERQAAVEALKRSRCAKFVELARGSLQGLAPPAQKAVREVLQARGMA